jgi:acyl-CoA thioesterase I
MMQLLACNGNIVRPIRLFVGSFILFTSLSLAAAESSAPPSELKTILVLGDSLAAGYGLDPSEAFPALLQRKIERLNWNYTVVNAGVSGDTSASGLRRINWLLRRKLDVLILELGANDGLRGVDPAITQKNLQGIIDQAKEKYPDIQIVIAGMRMPSSMGADFNTRYERIFVDLAKQNDAHLVPFLLEGVGGDPNLNQEDLIHPTAEGQRILARNIWKVLRPALESL